MLIATETLNVCCELSGNEAGPVVMLSHALGSSKMMWQPQLAALEPTFRVLRYDTRGHGGSDAPPGPYTLNQLGDDAIGLLDALDIGEVHWVGLSMGGMIGQNIALRYADRLASVTLCDTIAVVPPDAQPMWSERIDLAQAQGLEPLADATMQRWFTASFRETHPETVAQIRAQMLKTTVAGYVGCCHAIRELNYLELLSTLSLPAALIVGEDDPTAPVAAAEAMCQRIPRAKLTVIPAAAHLSNVEQTAAFNDAVGGFLRNC